jgi:manganese efflux pump family protein
MSYLTILLIAISLSFDSFAVSISSGISHNKISFFNATKIAFSLAFFQAAMPVLGWYIGTEIRDYVKNFDHWLAFSLLFILGGKMIYDSIRAGKDETPFNPLNFWVLIGISLATSIDAFIVGISFGFIGTNIIAAIIIIGAVTFIVSMLGILFGKTAGKKLGKIMEVLGGVILIGIGTDILITHLIN